MHVDILFVWVTERQRKAGMPEALGQIASLGAMPLQQLTSGVGFDTGSKIILDARPSQGGSRVVEKNPCLVDAGQAVRARFL